ncbi:hypothetical protein QYE76_030765 [Lolium multiflorum]|uniref:Uncharacterized protein n=1 Tax=Lolium multiflorum TaxID=4521 RepID=A0AAD8QSV3_LOLMU|nr:hypothetical protein QYE76_030765 [Lolium multiflorum]
MFFSPSHPCSPPLAPAHTRHRTLLHHPSTALVEEEPTTPETRAQNRPGCRSRRDHARHGRALATRRAATSRSPWPRLLAVEHHHATTTPPDMTTTRPWTAAAVNGEEDPATAATCLEATRPNQPLPDQAVAAISSPGHMEPNEPINTKFYQLGNGGSLIFENDLNAVSDFLGRPHPEFHGVQLDDTPGGEWVTPAFSFRESNWLDGLARALQEALARLCGQNVVRLLASRYAHLVRRDAAGVPMELQPHPELRHHAEHLDFMLYQTQKDLDASRAYANQTHAHITEQGEAIKLLNNDRKSLRQQRAKKDATIRRLRARIASLEATVKAQEDQIRQLEDDDGGIDIQGGDAFLSDDDDFEEDENTEEEDYEFLEAGPDDYVPIDVDDEE